MKNRRDQIHDIYLPILFIGYISPSILGIHYDSFLNYTIISNIINSLALQKYFKIDYNLNVSRNRAKI